MVVALCVCFDENSVLCCWYPGCLYAYRLTEAGKHVTILVRSRHSELFQEKGLELIDEIKGEREIFKPHIVVGAIDAWLKIHVALVIPSAHALSMHGYDNFALPKDDHTLRVMVRAAREDGMVLKALGMPRRQLFSLNKPYWLPEILSVQALKHLLNSKFAEVAFSMCAQAGQEEIKHLFYKFQTLIDKTSMASSNIDLLNKSAATCC